MKYALVPCKLCEEEWGPADMNPAGLCPGCVDDLSARTPDAGEPAGLHYAQLAARAVARQEAHLAGIRERAAVRRAEAQAQNRRPFKRAA